MKDEPRNAGIRALCGVALAGAILAPAVGGAYLARQGPRTAAERRDRAPDPAVPYAGAARRRV